MRLSFLFHPFSCLSHCITFLFFLPHLVSLCGTVDSVYADARAVCAYMHTNLQMRGWWLNHDA